RCPGMPQPCIFSQDSVDLFLVLGIIDLKGFDSPPWEAWLAEVVLGEFGLEATDHDGVQLSLVGRCATGKSLVVKKFQESRKALRITVVRRGGQEELVLEVRGEEAHSFGAE